MLATEYYMIWIINHYWIGKVLLVFDCCTSIRENMFKTKPIFITLNQSHGAVYQIYCIRANDCDNFIWRIILSSLNSTNKTAWFYGQKQKFITIFSNIFEILKCMMSNKNWPLIWNGFRLVIALSPVNSQCVYHNSANIAFLSNMYHTYGCMYVFTIR